MALPPRLFIIIYFTRICHIKGKILELAKIHPSGFSRLKLVLTRKNWFLQPAHLRYISDLFNIFFCRIF